jgi:hypothetical protein
MKHYLVNVCFLFDAVFYVDLIVIIGFLFLLFAQEQKENLGENTEKKKKILLLTTI